LCLSSSFLLAQNPPKPEPKPESADAPDAPLNAVKVDRRASQKAISPEEFFRDNIKPLPPVAIPDDPPPHEGAFLDIVDIIEPPDIIVVEILEALPGRPITGEFLVRPDGTISLGFYGVVQVRGLTLSQAKVKILLHLRKHLSDRVLGLTIEDFSADVPEHPTGPEGPGNFGPASGRSSFNLDQLPPPADEGSPIPESGKDVDPKPKGAQAQAKSRPGRSRNVPRAPRVRSSEPQVVPSSIPQAEKQDPQIRRPVDSANRPGPEVDKSDAQPEIGDSTLILVEPSESNRAFVDIVSRNSKVYYVLGEVGVPGRLPFTGKETVLDALRYAGDLLANGEPEDIHLYRPARGGKPAKDYKVDLDAIRKGVATANLQMFPDDRLFIGRNAIVAKTAEIDRAAGLVNSLMNSILQYSLTARSMAAMNTPPTGAIQFRANGQVVANDIGNPSTMSIAERDALILSWAEFFWSVSNKEGGAMLDEKAFGEALRKKLAPASPPK
jgi:protein involved in polysaccharide export with SLBB domain